MKSQIINGLILIAAMGMAVGAMAEDGAADVPSVPAMQEAQAEPGQAVKTEVKRVIVVSLQDRKLALVEDGKVKKVYAVAVGKPSTPSPEGTFTIERRVANPTYHHGDKTIGPGPGNPVGTRWMGLSKAGYGIHGTNEPNSIGKAASHGCIRMGKADLEEFYTMVQVGDTVELIGQRNEETAQLFEAPRIAAPVTTTPVVMAKVAPVQTKVPVIERVKADVAGAVAMVMAAAATR